MVGRFYWGVSRTKAKLKTFFFFEILQNVPIENTKSLNFSLKGSWNERPFFLEFFMSHQVWQ